MNNRIERIIDALAIGATVIASEHFFSTFLSSPLTVATLYSEKPEDREMTKLYLYEAIAVSIVFGAVMSYILNDPLGLITAVVICVLYYLIYMDALGEINLDFLHNLFLGRKV